MISMMTGWQNHMLTVCKVDKMTLCQLAFNDQDANVNKMTQQQLSFLRRQVDKKTC